MAYSINTKEKAIGLRKSGYSIKEIAKIINISTSTSSVWVNSVPLDKHAQDRLKKRKMLGQAIASQKRVIKNKFLNKKIEIEVKNIFNHLKTKENYPVFCALLFWAEGTKTTNNVTFTNSDPKMISTFLTLLRKSFTLDESKFRCLIHLHKYHDESKIKTFWSKITNVPVTQFSRSYLKPNTSKNIHPDYKGCLRIRYYDHTLALKLKSIYNSFSETITGV